MTRRPPPLGMRQPLHVQDATVVLELKGLRVEARPRPSYFDRWFNCRISVAAFPFFGVIETIFTDEDFLEFSVALDQLDPTGVVTLGGDRATELRLDVGHQIGGGEGKLAIECFVTPSGNDPYPSLRFLIFGASPFAEQAAARLRCLATIDPWPKP